MSQITKQDINKIARLAKIEIDEDARNSLTTQVDGVIKWVEQLGEVNTDNISPLTNVNGIELRMAQDEISDGDIVDDVLRNAKEVKYNYFAVPKVIE